VSIYRMVLAGLTTMSAVALCSAIWPAVAAVITDLFVFLLVVVVAVPTGLGVRWVQREVAWRRDLRATPAVTVPADATAPVAPTLAELRESA
jgi:hypothetical protein